MAKRQEALIAALDDMLDWLEKGEMMSTLVQASKPLSLPLPLVQCEKNMKECLHRTGYGQVAIFDATNSTRSRRQFLVRPEVWTCEEQCIVVRISVDLYGQVWTFVMVPYHQF